MKKPVGRKVPHRRTLAGQPGRIVRPPHTTNNLRAPGQPPESIQLDTTLFDAMAERRRSPRPPKKMARKGTRRTVSQNDTVRELAEFPLAPDKDREVLVRKRGRTGKNPFALLRAL